MIDDEDLISFDDEPLDQLVLWQQQILPQWEAQRKTAKVRRHVLEGDVPTELICTYWRTALGSTAEDEAGFEAASNSATSLRERLEYDWDGSLRRSDPQLDDLAVIAADVPRTLPDRQRDGTLDAAALQAVLDAYVASARGGSSSQVDVSRSGGGSSSAESHDGYSQGMADVGAWLLRNGLSPRQGYGCLHALSRRRLIRSIMGLEQACWGAVCAVYEAHLGRHSPLLLSHLGSVGLQPFFFLPEWLVALWCRSLTDECCTLAWNLLMLDCDRFLLGSSLGVTLALGPLLMQCTDLPSCRDVLRDGPRGMSLESFRDAATQLLEPALLQPLAAWMELGPESYCNCSVSQPTSTRSVRRALETEPPRATAQAEL